MQPDLSRLPHDGQSRRLFFQSRTLFCMPENVISTPAQSVVTPRARACGSMAIDLFSTVSAALKPADVRGGAR
jgi:hypothetical protein